MLHSEQHERSIFQKALDIDSEAERMAYLDETCGSNPTLRRAVEGLLDAHHAPQGLLDVPDAACLSAVPNASRAIGTSIGPYRLVEVIGEGGFGVVYLADQTEPVRREVALKIIKPGMDTAQVLARFEAERQALAMMDHPNIAKVFDGGTTEAGRPYFVMELVKGVPITEYCDQCELGTPDRLRLFVTVCQAVQHAHQKGIIHRDLKPSNVMVAMQDGQAAAKIIDFGVAKAIGQKLTAHSLRTQYAQMIGTPMYMSPEQAELRPIDVDTRSDVYSLGVLLYELLTGTTPFSRQRLAAASFDELRHIIREEEPPRPSAQVNTLAADASTTLVETHRIAPRQLAGQLRGELDWIVMKALAKDRTRRFPSAGDLAKDIERYLADEPVEARPPGTFYSVGKFARRNRALVASVVAILVALSIGLALATAGFLTAQRRLVQVKAEQEDNEILNQVLADLFIPVRGGEVAQQESSVRESLERISGDLEVRLRDHPKVEIEIRKIFARNLRKDGQHAKAQQHLQRALELAKREYGPEHEKVADVLRFLADGVQYQSEYLTDYAQSEDYARQAMEMYDRLGIETRQSADVLNCLSFALEHDINNRFEVERYLERALQIHTKLANGKDSHSQVYALGDLANHIARTQDGRDEYVNDLWQKAVDMSWRIHGDMPTYTAAVIRGQGDVFRLQGSVSRALGCYRQSWNIYVENDLQSEPSAHRTALSMAEIYFVENRYREAIAVLDEIEAICGEHPRLASSLAQCHYVRGWGELLREDNVAAENQLRKSLSLAETHLDDTHLLVPFAIAYLATSLDKQQRFAEAQAEWRRILPFANRGLELNPYDDIAHYARAWALLRSGASDSTIDALDHANAGLVLANKRPRRQRQPHLYLAKAVAQHESGNPDDAIKTLQSALDEVEFSSLWVISQNAPKTRRELELTLADYLVEQGRADEAKHVFVDGITKRIEQFGSEDHLQVALAELRYGTFLVWQGEFGRAERPLLHAYNKLSANPEAAKATVERAAAGLVTVYESTNRPAEAALWQAVLNQMDHLLDENEPEHETIQKETTITT